MDSDLSLITRIKENQDNESLVELINRHSGIYIDVVNKTVSDTCEFMNKKDILLDKNFSIYSAALKYEPERNAKFSTYLANETRWKCLNMYNRKRKMIECPLDDSIKKEASPENVVFNIQNNEIISKILSLAQNHPDKRVKKIIDMRYCIGYDKPHSWKSIAKYLNMSIQGCIDIHNKFILKIRKEITHV